MTEFTWAEAVQIAAEDLIGLYHERLKDVRVEYVFHPKVGHSHGRVVMAKARRISGLAAFLASTAGAEGAAFFVLDVALEAWEVLSAKQRYALVDHELAHMGVDEDGKPYLIGHDLEEFEQIVWRHGLWRSDIESFAIAIAGAAERAE